MIGFGLISAGASGANVAVISASSAGIGSGGEFIVKNVYTSGSVIVATWDGAILTLLGTVTSSPLALSTQVSNTINLVLINGNASLPIDVGYDGIRTV